MSYESTMFNFSHLLLANLNIVSCYRALSEVNDMPCCSAVTDLIVVPPMTPSRRLSGVYSNVEKSGIELPGTAKMAHQEQFRK